MLLVVVVVAVVVVDRGRTENLGGSPREWVDRDREKTCGKVLTKNLPNCCFTNYYLLWSDNTLCYYYIIIHILSSTCTYSFSKVDENMNGHDRSCTFPFCTHIHLYGCTHIDICWLPNQIPFPTRHVSVCIAQPGRQSGKLHPSADLNLWRNPFSCHVVLDWHGRSPKATMQHLVCIKLMQHSSSLTHSRASASAAAQIDSTWIHPSTSCTHIHTLIFYCTYYVCTRVCPAMHLDWASLSKRAKAHRPGIICWHHPIDQSTLIVCIISRLTGSALQVRVQLWPGPDVDTIWEGNQ